MSAQLGCRQCLPESADGAWQARGGLERDSEVVLESHFDVLVLRCPSCGQRFASVFCETIDWSGGEDPQDWLLVPVTDAEAEALVRAGEQGIERALGALAPERRYLVRSFPRDARQPDVRWIEGPVRLPRHD